MPEHRFRFYRLASSMKELDDVKAAARDLWRKFVILIKAVYDRSAG
jgi:hypothetical protein